MLKSVNPNTKEYWEGVKKNATRRRALDAVKRQFKTMQVSQVYEQYLDRCFGLVEWAARKEGFLNDPEQFQLFRQECADLMGMPEIVECDEEEVASAASEAVHEAATALYGESEGSYL